MSCENRESSEKCIFYIDFSEIIASIAAMKRQNPECFFVLR